MRVVGGEFRGRALRGPPDQSIRPTSDRLRQTIFDILAHGYGDPARDARVIDLFAGTGALGIEAMSRGGRYALFVDDGLEARGLIRDNIEALGLTGRSRIYRRDATRLGPAGNVAPFDLAFADPPYDRGLAAPALAALVAGGWLVSSAIVVLEEAAGVAIPAIAGLEMLESRTVGDSRVHFLRALP